MCDYGSDFSGVDLYDMPEFPGHGPLQVGFHGGPDFDASVEGARQWSPESGTVSDDDVLFVMSRPVQAALRPQSPVLNNTAHYVQDSTLHVAPFEQLIWHPAAPRETVRAIPKPPAALNHSAGPVRTETNAQQQQRLLRRIVANPHRRKKRAAALNELQREAAKLNFESEQAPLQIWEIQKLAQKSAFKTESTSSELFVQYVNQARRRHLRSVAKAQRGARPSENAPQLPGINLGNAQEPEPVLVQTLLVRRREVTQTQEQQYPKQPPETRQRCSQWSHYSTTTV